MTRPQLRVKKLASGRKHRSGLVEFSVKLSPSDAEKLRDRAGYSDRFVGEQIRRDVVEANKNHRGEE